MEQIIQNIEDAAEHVKEALRERISFIIKHDLDGLLEVLADDPLQVERCFGPDVMSLIQSWHYLTVTAGELFEVNDADEAARERAMNADDFIQAGINARETRKVIDMDSYTHPSDEEFNF
mgnify:CR=1 FL=1